MVSDTYINRASESYRRGVIFGLTIAEVLLLLIFCILLLLKFTFDQKNKEIEQLDNNNENLTKQIDTFEAWISTIPVTNIKSGLVETVLNTLDEEQRENLLANASLAANKTPSELADMQARADEWEELTTLSRYSVSEEEHALLNTLDEEQRENLLANASLAANKTPSELADMQARADEWEELTTLSRYSVSEEEHALLNTLDEEQRENLLANASLAANKTPSELADMQARADEWEELTTLSRYSVSEEEHALLNTLDEEQRENLLANASLAANKTPSELADMQARADEWEELTTLSRYSVSEEEHALLNTLDEEQRENLLANASLAANKTPSELADMQARAEISNNKWPPIISLSEARNYSFEVGSATLAPQFKQALKGKIAEQILALLNEFDADIIEVIGHTDQQPMSSTRTTNLDKIPLSFLTSNLDLTLNARDNAGLGYSRALSVIKELRKVPSLQKYTILPYSAAQMITPDEELNTGINDYDRALLRRIEIRVRRKQKGDL